MTPVKPVVVTSKIDDARMPGVRLAFTYAGLAPGMLAFLVIPRAELARFLRLIPSLYLCSSEMPLSTRLITPPATPTSVKLVNEELDLSCFESSS